MQMFSNVSVQWSKKLLSHFENIYKICMEYPVDVYFIRYLNGKNLGLLLITKTSAINIHQYKCTCITVILISLNLNSAFC